VPKRKAVLANPSQAARKRRHRKQGAPWRPNFPMQNWMRVEGNRWASGTPSTPA